MSEREPRILIVDDEEQIRRLLREYLEDSDEFSVITAHSAEQALETLAGETVDLCVVDMRLPGMNGEEFILAARERNLCRHFLLHTGSMDTVLSFKLQEAGLTQEDVFIKPGDQEKLTERIRALLGG